MGVAGRGCGLVAGQMPAATKESRNSGGELFEKACIVDRAPSSVPAVVHDDDDDDDDDDAVCHPDPIRRWGASSPVGRGKAYTRPQPPSALSRGPQTDSAVSTTRETSSR